MVKNGLTLYLMLKCLDGVINENTTVNALSLTLSLFNERIKLTTFKITAEEDLKSKLDFFQLASGEYVQFCAIRQQCRK